MDNHTPMYGTLVKAREQAPRHAVGPLPHRAGRAGPLACGFMLLGVLLLAGCQGTAPAKPQRSLLPEVQRALTESSSGKPSTVPPAVAQQLTPRADLSMPPLANRPPEPRFDLNVVGLPVAQVFAALAKDTRYSVLLDPDLKGSVTVSLKDVTLIEALDTLRDMYGFEYRVQGTRIFVQPTTLQTRVFQVSYPTMNRAGRSEVRVTSGSISQGGTSSIVANSAIGGTSAGGASGVGGATLESSRITTQTRNDVWAELEASLRLLLSTGGDRGATGDGRQLIVSPQSGVVVVRALPRDLRAVEQYLRAARLNIERQVVLEAKIIDVRLRDGQQSGVNWAAFVNGDNTRGSGGLLSPGTALRPTGSLTSGLLGAVPGSSIALDPAASAGVFGLAFQTSNFAALLQFLETQGDVQVLSSPRIAAMNNQSAVLKVGTDDFFVTSVSTNIQTGVAGGQPISTPNITVQPFFSGVALNVTPQIDEDSNIILHVHPSVTDVTEKPKVVNLGNLGNFTLPLASSQISETDTIVRVRDGNIVAIGGLMTSAQLRDRSQVPALGDLPMVGGAFRSTAAAQRKSELVILLKPTVIHSDAQMDALRADSLDRMLSLTRP